MEAIDYCNFLKNAYVLSVWKNHESPKDWIYDICPYVQYFRHSAHFVIHCKEPYNYSPLFIGTHDQCSARADALEKATSDIPYDSMTEERLEALLKPLVDRILAPSLDGLEGL